MCKIVAILLLLSILMNGKEIVVVVDKNFPLDRLAQEEIKSFFLNKKSFIKKRKVLVMNHEYNSEIRTCFEKVILHKTKKSLERYWRKAYYKGYRPPKVVKSTDMLLSYLQHVSPSIGYLERDKLDNKQLKILYTGKCP
jgi:ABC-type phosphate transport system substrate-binding protein